MSCAMALVALGVGYIVLLQANKEKEGLKLLGQVIAILIILGAVCSSICSSVKCMRGGSCGMGHSMNGMSSKAPMCPMGGKSMDDSAQQ